MWQPPPGYVPGSPARVHRGRVSYEVVGGGRRLQVEIPAENSGPTASSKREIRNAVPAVATLRQEAPRTPTGTPAVMFQSDGPYRGADQRCLCPLRKVVQQLQSERDARVAELQGAHTMINKARRVRGRLHGQRGSAASAASFARQKDKGSKRLTRPFI